jgi:large subunit ribosomal protein L21
MYAVIKTGGKQYKVANGDVILVEKLESEAGASITLEVLMIGDGANITVGAPTVKGASVAAEVVEQVKADKVIIFKKNRRHNYRRKNGHRQKLTALKITGINAA